jgi:hypothetical protein
MEQGVLTARNVHEHALTDFWYGGLNYQIEHHLFPSMPPNQLKKAPCMKHHSSSDHQMIAVLLLIDRFVSTGMCLPFPHSFISNRVKAPTILCHFLYVPQKLIPRFSLKQT